MFSYNKIFQIYCQFKIISYFCIINNNIINNLKNTIMEKMSDYILRILKGNNIFVFWSWGPSHFEILYDEYGSDMGIKFLVNGHHHKGFVEVN